MYTEVTLLLCIILAICFYKLEVSLYHDWLTNLFNRRFLNRYNRRSVWNRRIRLVIMLDIDNFKHYNDKYGHNVGDEILIEVSTILVSITRKSDKVIRWGGDEFMIVSKINSYSDMKSYMSRLQLDFKASPELQILTSGVEETITVSWGASRVLRFSTAKADKLMYQNKNKLKRSTQ